MENPDTPPTKIAKLISHAGITFEVFRPEELPGIPIFGEPRQRRNNSSSDSNNKKRKADEEEEGWEKRRRTTIECELFDRVFIGLETQACNEGERLPRLPDWLNAVREDQWDTRAPGVFLVQPSLEDFRTRFVEMMGVLEAIGVEMGVVKIKIPEGWNDSPPIPSPESDSAPPDLELYTMTQRLPLHPSSKSNLAPIYHVTSSTKHTISASRWRDIIRIPTRPAAALSEIKMCFRGRQWNNILTGIPRDGPTHYSSDNDITDDLRSYLSLSDPKLTSLPGNVLHDNITAVTGIHTPYLYIGQAYTMFALHTEDYNALSLNYQHSGAPKSWRVCSPRSFTALEDFIAASIPNTRNCSQFVRHQSIYLPRETLEKAGVRSTLVRQFPGEMVITWPLAYHQGWNEGVNVNEACGYGNERWRELFPERVRRVKEGRGAGGGVYRACSGRCVGREEPVRLVYGGEE
ncbi:unnamed protein product [Tuber aestivum]|uniref:JmjC domain-containing protein n=1 Tax=Tuber aestivum TaxID=59557 RepID=A0A292PTX5_9PEZI|nr:unnamed protein product [Tuber aestivum]